MSPRLNPSLPLFSCALDGCRSLLVLTGAGVSAESGVPTFRGPEGLWRNHDPMELATPEAFQRDPLLVWEWYDWRRTVIAKCQPNPAHHAIVELERRVPEFLLVTQNVDGLHGLAGSRTIAEIHGNIWRIHPFGEEGPETEDRRVPIPPDELPLRDGDGRLLRPGVVWYGEMLRPDALFRMQQFLARGPDLILVVGTSAQVTWVPALLGQARFSGSTIININPDRGGVASIANHHIAAPAGEFFGEWLAGIDR